MSLGVTLFLLLVWPFRLDIGEIASAYAIMEKGSVESIITYAFIIKASKLLACIGSEVFVVKDLDHSYSLAIKYINEVKYDSAHDNLLKKVLHFFTRKLPSC